MLLKAFVLICAVAFVAADPEKPVWPTQFDVPFGLNCVIPPIHNATSVFYYNWDVQSQMLDYSEKCFPFAHYDSGFYPCKLYFNPKGIYLAQPKIGKDCCLMVDGVGAVPPNFLAPFNFTGTVQAADMWGVEHNTNNWVGIDDFHYWTDVQSEVDIQFQDGPTGVKWNFGNFNVRNESASLFQLPQGDCSQSCGFLDSEVLREPLIRLAVAHHRRK